MRQVLSIDAVILAAGLGTRLMPITAHIPKPLIAINREPIISRHINILQSIGIKRIAVNSHSLSEQMQDYFANHHHDANLCLSFEKDLLGTGGGIKRCLVEAQIKGYFMLVSTDIYTHFNLHSFLQNFQKLPNKNCGLMLVKPSKKADAYLNNRDTVCSTASSAVSPLHQSNAQGSPIQFAGIAILPEPWFTSMAATEFTIWQQCLLAYLKTGQLYGTLASNIHIDIGTHEGLADARNQDLRFCRQYNTSTGSQATIASWNDTFKTP